MAPRNLERRVDIPEHEIVESERPLSVAEANAGAPVAEEKPPHALHARRGQPGERRVQLRALLQLRNSAVRAPCIGPEVDAVMHPRQIGTDQK